MRNISLLGLITLIFVVSKIAGWITFSWLWVFAPLWLPIAVVLGGLALFWIVALLLILIGVLWDAVASRPKKRK